MCRWLSKVWTFSVPSAELFSVYPLQTFSLVQQYLEKMLTITLVYKGFSISSDRPCEQILVSRWEKKKNINLATYVLFECFCAARCRSSWAPSSSSSSSLSVGSSGWPPHCGDGSWHPLILLWLLPSPLRPLVAAQPPFSASLLPATKQTSWQHRD